MSNLERAPAETVCGGAVATAEPMVDVLPGRDVPLGRYTTVRRLLPHRQRQMVGGWCFLDHFGPDPIGTGAGMRVPPHPHTGLQTVTWLLDGEVLHHDSLGSAQRIRPGQLNLMTSGAGIAHSEQSPPEHPPLLHGLQLWIALPHAARRVDARFEHHPRLPGWRNGDLGGTVVVGEFGGERSPAAVHGPLVGVEVTAGTDTSARLPLRTDFEYAVVVMTGVAEIAGVPLTPGSLLYLGRGRDDLPLGTATGARLFLLGGEPFEEELVMWWNFVARSHEEIVEARRDWVAGRRFGAVRGYPGDRLAAPPMPTTRLKPRDRHGRTAEDH